MPWAAERTPAAHFHTSHPRLNAALRRSPRWQLVSANLTGQNKGRCGAGILASAERNGTSLKVSGGGYGGHFRAVTGWRMTREALPCA